MNPENSPYANTSAAEVEAAFEGPAIFANKVLITAFGQLVRLSFIETAPIGANVPPQSRAGIIMGFQHLVELKLAIANLEEQHLAAMTKSANG